MGTATRHVIWDWNGTLLDDAEVCVASINRMLRERGLEAIDLPRYRDLFNFPVRDYYERLGFDLSTEDWDAMAKEFHSHYDRLASDAPLRDGVEPILTELQNHGVAMSVLSACQEETLNTMLRERGIDGLFEEICGLGDLYASSKLDLGRALLETLGLAPHEAIMIGDTQHDYDVADALGCRCVLLLGGHNSHRRLNQCDCPVVSRPEETLEFAISTA